jgi:hypothetical protein
LSRLHCLGSVILRRVLWSAIFVCWLHTGLQPAWLGPSLTRYVN